jgi:hypothetical protein
MSVTLTVDIKIQVGVDDLGLIGGCELTPQAMVGPSNWRSTAELEIVKAEVEQTRNWQ